METDLIKSTEEAKDNIRISYQGEWYDVTAFDHPGEGSGVYLVEYNGKAIDEEIETSHATDEPFAILAEAKKKGEFHGVKYLGKIICSQ